MALAVSLLLAPAAFAQTDLPVQYQHEKYELKNGVGFNKYLVSTTPNENSEYTLRLETFVTGGVKASALPTDFVLVIDNSGSMYYDYRPYGLTARPMRIPLTDEGLSDTSNEKLLLPYLVEGYGPSDVSVGFQPYTGLTYSRPYQFSTVGSRVGEAAGFFYQTFYGENDAYTTNNRATRYYRYEDPSNTSNNGYYRIFQRTEGGKYNLAIKLKDGTYRYLYGNTVSATANTTITRTDQVIYNGPNVYHVKSRQEALLEGAKAFIGRIAKENGKDQWRAGVTKHQVALVSFSVGYAGGSASITEYPSALPSNDTKVIKSFSEVDDSTTWYGYVRDRMTFRGGQTCIDYGVNLAKMLLTDLETKDGGKYAALNSSGGVLRQKVVVVFTDGEPWDEREGQKRNFFQITNPCIQYGKTIKEVGVGKLNGRIYTIDLCMSNSTEDFLGHLSSNYPKGGCSATSGNYSTGKFNGKKIPWTRADAASDEEWEYLQYETEAHYYKNTKDGDLSSVFSSIAEGNTGQQAGEKLVVMDVMSDSFELPANLSGKVKFYTAQCIGEKEIDGEKYLAFAREVPADERAPLAHLWVAHTEGTGAAAHDVWEDLGAAASGGLDIDQEIRSKKSSDGKSITVSGFEFVDLWCGKDEMIAHNNNTRQMASDDPNAAYAADGYRGFKLIIEFPIVVSPGAVGGTGVPTNNEVQSGFYHGNNDGTAGGDPIILYQKPVLTIPVQLAIQKKGLGPNESANFTIQRRTMVEGSEWTDYLSFVLTSTSDDSEPIQRILNLDPDYYYRVKEEGWSWAYSNRAQVEATFPSTEDPNLTNPIVIVNTPKDDTPKHAEAVVRNELKNY